MRIVTSVALLAALYGFSAHAADNCDPSGGLEYVCGPKNAEDLVRVPGTRWIIASGMDAGAGIKLIDSQNGRWSVLYPGDSPAAKHDSAAFPDCGSPPNPALLQTHGLNLRPGRGGHSTLYAVGHGAREAIEAYDVDSSGRMPSLVWTGCVPMPEGLAANSVASFADGSLVATVLLLPGKSFADSVARRPTGAVFEWSPGEHGFKRVEGTELPGNNGIETSPDGREFFVVSSGFQTIVAFSHTNPAKQLRSTPPLPFTPDNVHRAPDGRLLTAGMKNDVAECGGAPGPEHDLARLSTCPRGTIAMAIDRASMQPMQVLETAANPAFSNATMVLPIGGEYWIGSFSSDRVAHVAPR